MAGFPGSVEALVRARPELTGHWVLLVLGMVLGLFAAIVWLKYPRNVQQDPLAGVVAWSLVGVSGLLWTGKAGPRRLGLETALPVDRRQLVRAHLLAAWISTLTPVLVGFPVFAATSAIGGSLPPAAPLAPIVVGLLLHATLFVSVCSERVGVPRLARLVALLGLLATLWAAAHWGELPAAAGAAGLGIALAVTLWSASWAPASLEPHTARLGTGIRMPAWVLPALVSPVAVAAMASSKFPLAALPVALWFAIWPAALSLGSLRDLPALPLDRRAIARRMVSIPVVAVLCGTGLGAVWHDDGWLRATARIEPVRDATRDGYRAEVMPPLDFRELRLERDSQVRSLGWTLGFHVINRYAVPDGSDFDATLAAAEQMARDLYGSDTPVDRIAAQMLTRGPDGVAMPRIRLADREPELGVQFSAVFPEFHGRLVLRRAAGLGLCLVVGVLGGCWWLSRPRSFPALTQRQEMWRGIVWGGVTIAVFLPLADSEAGPIGLRVAGGWLLHPIGAALVVVVLLALGARVVRRVERMEIGSASVRLSEGSPARRAPRPAASRRRAPDRASPGWW